MYGARIRTEDKGLLATAIYTLTADQIFPSELVVKGRLRELGASRPVLDSFRMLYMSFPETYRVGLDVFTFFLKLDQPGPCV